jgi:phosphoglycolate phosphatase
MSTTISPSLNKALRHTQDLLLDFDGPICSIFAGYPAPTIAQHLRRVIDRKGHRLTPQILAEDDPLQVLRLATELHDEDLTRQLADMLREAELSATTSAEPTPYLTDVLVAAKQAKCRLTVVSNNSHTAVESYLRRHDLLIYFAAVVGRYDGMDPRHLKPDDHLIRMALAEVDASPSSTTLIGDSLSDIEAAKSAGIGSIGYANKPYKQEKLAAAGADAIVGSMAEVATAIKTQLSTNR